jgi:hypothetical protein
MRGGEYFFVPGINGLTTPPPPSVRSGGAPLRGWPALPRPLELPPRAAPWTMAVSGEWRSEPDRRGLVVRALSVLGPEHPPARGIDLATTTFELFRRVEHDPVQPGPPVATFTRSPEPIDSTPQAYIHTP